MSPDSTPSGLSRNGIFNMLLGALSLATMGAVTKTLGKQFSSVELVFFRNLIGTCILGISFLARPAKQTGGQFGMLAFRGLIGTLSLFAFFYCLTKLQLAVANTYNLTYPIFIGVISAAVFKTNLKKIQWLAILLGFGGVVLIFRPDLNFPLKFHLIGLFTGFATAIGYTMINRLHGIYDRRVIVLSFLLSGLILSVISIGVGSFYQNPDLDFILARFIQPQGTHWIWILAMGVLALLGQTFITRAFSFGKPNVVGSINFVQIPFAMVYGFFLGDMVVDFLSYAGILLIAVSGMIMIVFSRRMT